MYFVNINSNNNSVDVFTDRVVGITLKDFPL